MKTIKPESIALFCLLSGDVDLAKHLAEILPITCFVGEDWQQDFQPLDGGPVQSLSDAFPKIVLTLDRFRLGTTSDGIEIRNIVDWLLG